MNETRHVIESPGWAIDKLRQYEEAAGTYEGAMDAAFDARLLVTMKKDSLKSIESEVIANGGFGAWAIDGRNAEARSAQLEVALQNHVAYQDTLADMRKAERDQARFDNEATGASNVMKAARLAIEWSTSYMALRAAAEGRLSREVNSNGSSH